MTTSISVSSSLRTVTSSVPASPTAGVQLSVLVSSSSPSRVSDVSSTVSPSKFSSSISWVSRSSPVFSMAAQPQFVAFSHRLVRIDEFDIEERLFWLFRDGEGLVAVDGVGVVCFSGHRRRVLVGRLDCPDIETELVALACEFIVVNSLLEGLALRPEFRGIRRDSLFRCPRSPRWR